MTDRDSIEARHANSDSFQDGWDDAIGKCVAIINGQIAEARAKDGLATSRLAIGPLANALGQIIALTPSETDQ